MLISHDLNIVYKYTDNVMCLSKRMLAFGKPNIVLDKDNLSSLYGEDTELLKHDHPY
jgi:zinc transport system ATP-binding protein